MKNQSAPWRTLHIFWRYTRPYKFQFFIGAAGAILGVIFQDIIPPFLVSRAFALLQAANLAGQHVTFSQLLPYSLGFGVSMLAALVVWRIQGYATWLFEIHAERDLMTDVFEHLVYQGQKFHADRFGGALVSQSTKFVGAYERILDDFIWSILPGLTVFLASLAILAFVAPWFALILLGIICVYVLIMKWRIRIQFPFDKRRAESETKQTAALADAITNVSTVRAFAQEAYEHKRFAAVAEDAHTNYRKLAIEVFKNDSTSHTMTNTLRITSIFFGVYAITNLHADASVLYLVISYTAAVVDRLWLFGRIVRNMNRAFGDASEMTDIFSLQPEVNDSVHALKTNIKRGLIDFQNVTFAYPEKPDEPLFEKLNLRIKSGEKVGLVGHSGGGKTTITRLLLRFMDIQQGAILIDDYNSADIMQTDLRNAIAYVPQEPMLFHRTLIENIQYGSPEATKEQVVAVAKMAHAHEFIEQLSHGYDTLVGERGVKLSGGQRQRVAIARAMLKNAPILVLDEATSAPDSDSEQLIQDALWKLMEGRTAIVVAHRLSTIQKMDRILVLEEGRIIEQGSHKDLLVQNGTYAKLWKHQSGGFLEE